MSGLSRLQSALTKTSSGAKTLLSKGTAIAEVQFNELMKNNAEFVVKDGSKEGLLMKQWVFTKLSKLPGILKEAGEEYKKLPELWAKRGDMTVGQAGVAAFFGIEVFAWFSLGEIIGRGGTITGYYF